MNYSYLSNLDYNAGIYIRLSQEDKDKKYESDSESVTNQKDINNYMKIICLGKQMLKQILLKMQ